MPKNLVEKIGGFTVLKKISTIIVEEMKEIKYFYDKIVHFDNQPKFEEGIADNLNNLLRNNFDQC